MLAKRSGLSVSFVNDVVKGKRKVGAKSAVALEFGTGTPAISFLIAQVQEELDNARKLTQK